MSIAVYIRVSSYSQKSDSQRADIRRWLTAHGHDLDTVQWFEDRETGATLQRSGFMALREVIFAGTVKTVVVWKLDRLARSMREGINSPRNCAVLNVSERTVRRYLALPVSADP